MSNKILFENARIITMQKEIPLADNMLIEDSQILDLNVKRSVHGDAEVYDLQGKTVLPGLNDSHIHMLVTGVKEFDMVDLRGAKSVGEIQSRVRQHIDENPPRGDEWVIGWGWNDTKFKENDSLTRWALDDVTETYPTFLTRVCGHVGVMNTAALKRTNIDAATEVEGGEIDTDRNNNITGIVREAARLLVYKSIPDYSVEEIKKYLKKAGKMFRKSGLTAVQTDDLVEVIGSKDRILQAYRELLEENALPLRVILKLRLHSPGEVEKYIVEKPEFDFRNYDRFNMGPLKLFADGSLGGKTASLKAPYRKENDNYGIMVNSPHKLETMIEVACQNDIQVACHAIGDRAMEIVLNILEKMKERYGSLNRPRIVHAQVTNLNLIDRIKELGAVVDVQPPFVGSEWYHAEDVLGQQRSFNTYAWKTMMNKGITVAGGSDSPVESFKPFPGIRCAVTRQNKNNEPAGGWQPGEKVTTHEALKMYTVNSAYSGCQENNIGKLAQGYRADFIAIDRDPFSIPADELDSINVKTSVVGGEIEEYQ